VEKLSFDPISLNNSAQNCRVKRVSRSITIDGGKPQYFTMCLKNIWAACSVVHSLGAGMKVASPTAFREWGEALISQLVSLTRSCLGDTQDKS